MVEVEVIPIFRMAPDLYLSKVYCSIYVADQQQREWLKCIETKVVYKNFVYLSLSWQSRCQGTA